MRQIVQLNKPIVQEGVAEWHSKVGIAGRAHATAWHGEAMHIEWNLESGIGFLLVTNGMLEATCAAGNKTSLYKGDLLILNQASTALTAFYLEAAVKLEALLPAPSNGAAASCALYGSIKPTHAHWQARPFAPSPAHAMAVARLSEREFMRAATLGQLLADETVGTASVEDLDTATTKLITTLETTLFDALANVLCERDPMSVPQLAGGGHHGQQLQKALLAMMVAPEKPWRIDTMARAAGMSRTAFAIRFKEVLRQTPLDYLTALRIQHAMTLLANTPRQTIDSAAREVGYADESALRRAYQRAMGKPFKRTGVSALSNAP